MKKIVSMILALMLVFSMSAALAANGNSNLDGNKCTIVVVVSDNRTPSVEWSYPDTIKINATKNSNASWSFALAGTYKLVITSLLMKDTQTLKVGMVVNDSEIKDLATINCKNTANGNTTPLEKAFIMMDVKEEGYDADAVAALFTSATWEFPISLVDSLAVTDYEEPELDSHIINSSGTELEVAEKIRFAVQAR